MKNPACSASELSTVGSVLTFATRKNILPAYLSLALGSTLCLSLGLPAANAEASSPANSASTADSASTTDSLSKLEKRLFEFTYSSEDDDARLNRLETFVFGSKQTGSTAERLANLQAAVVNQPPAASASAAAPTGNGGSETASAAPGTGATAPTETYPAFDYANYPRVTELEQSILGTTYTHDALPDRLSRLETKAFGKPLTTEDLAQRVDGLDRYAQRNDIFHERRAQPVASNEFGAPSQTGAMPIGGGAPMNAYGGAPQPQWGAAVQGTDQRVAMMEQSVFGRSYANRPLADRVERLEKKMVPYEHNLGKNDLPARVDHLWSILSVANTLQGAPVAANQTNMMANQQLPAAASSAKEHPWLHKLGKVAAIAGRMAESSMMGGGMYNGGMMGGYGGPGFFP